MEDIRNKYVALRNKKIKDQVVVSGIVISHPFAMGKWTKRDELWKYLVKECDEC